MSAAEGEVRVDVSVRARRGCDNCGEPATKCIWFCYVNGRSNPASSMYGRDDCTYCRDAEAFACDQCERQVERGTCPDGMKWGATVTVGPGREHYFLHWRDQKASPEVIAAVAALVGPQS